MQPLFYVMAIMGCGDAGTGCEAARVADARYPTAAACQAAASDVLTMHTDLDYPVLRIDCRKSTKPVVLRRAG